MGSYNVACSLTNLSIDCGDPCYFIPLIRNQYFNGEIPNCSHIVSNDGAGALFQPIFLPIKGEYGDYGRMENVEQNENTKRIEELTGKDIESFIDAVQDGEITVMKRRFINDYEDVQVDVSGCWVHAFAYREAIEYMVANPVLEYHSSHSGRVSTMQSILTKRDENRAIAGDFANKSHDELIAALSSVEKDDLRKMIWAALSSHVDYDLGQVYRYYFDVPEKYEPLIVDGNKTIIRLLGELRLLFMYMYCNNRLLMPIMSGPQLGEPRASESLLKKSLKFINDKLKKMED